MSEDPGSASSERAPAWETPPATFGARLGHLGPGLIITGSIVGSGELIMTTKLGAEVGFTLLWLIILGCLVKVFVQVELGRYAMSSGESTLKAMNRMPGPRLASSSWLIWLWLIMFLCLFFQVGGIIRALAGVFTLGLGTESKGPWVLLVVASVILLLMWGRYKIVERVSTSMVFLFTIWTILAVVLLQWTDFPLTGGELWEGMKFQISQPDGARIDFTTALAAFGITGVGASELVYYPYWCLEKGYARYVGPADGSKEWTERARGWIRVLYLDAWLSLVVYTVATIAFYLLGAAVLYKQNIQLQDADLVPNLSTMYQESFGAAGFLLFLVGAFFVLYSTFFVATASNARLVSDALSVFGLRRYRTSEDATFVIRVACIVLPLIGGALAFAIEKPVTLVFVGALAQACMLPLLAAAALYLRYRRTDRTITPGWVWSAGLWISFASMAAIGIYQLLDKLGVFSGGSS